MPSQMTNNTLLSVLQQQVECALGTSIGQLRVQRVVFGVFFTAVLLDNGVAGLAATPLKDIPAAVCCPSSAQAFSMSGKLAGKPVADLLRDLQQPLSLRRTLALAVLNALAETLLQRDGPPAGWQISEGDSFSAVRIAATDKVLLVGAFGPYIRALRKAGQDFRVLEQDPATLRSDEMAYYVPAVQAGDVLPWADVLIVTGTTLLNGSLGGLLDARRPGGEVALVGPSVPLLAEPLAERGVTLLGGVRVGDAPGTLDLLAEGASGYHLFERTVSRVNLRRNPMT